MAPCQPMQLSGLQERLAQLQRLGALATPLVEKALLETVAPTANGRTPLEEKGHLEGQKSAESQVRLPTIDEAQLLLEGVETGKEPLFQREADEGTIQPGSGFKSLGVKGFPPTPDTDFAIVSAPGSDPCYYLNVVYYCAAHGIGLAAVFEAHFDGQWFSLWKRNVQRMVDNGKKLLVLTQAGKLGQLGFAQSMEVEHLKERGHEFSVVDVRHFCLAMRPLLAVTGMVCDGELELPALHQLLDEEEGLEGVPPLFGTTAADGATALHVLASRSCKAGEAGLRQALQLLLRTSEGRALLERRTFPGGRTGGLTPLAQAAQRGQADLVQLLLDLGADVQGASEVVPERNGAKVLETLGRAVEERGDSSPAMECGCIVS